jgi:hypothetical protein
VLTPLLPVLWTEIVGPFHRQDADTERDSCLATHAVPGLEFLRVTVLLLHDGGWEVRVQE